MFSFRNIDNFVPSKFERMGMLKGKRWYRDSKNNVLFKPKREEFGDKKVFCANHYGEFMGYILAVLSETPACKVELAHLSKYYSNIHKERNGGTPIEKDGCITYSILGDDDELEHGNNIVEFYNNNSSKELANNYKSESNSSDNLEIVLSSIENKTRDFYKSKEGCFQEYIELKVKNNRSRAIKMMVYDCLYGNNDRHDENWAMKRNSRDIEMYPLYDNERVLGLYENQNFIEDALKKGMVEEISEGHLFSRMYVPEEKKGQSNYKDVLEYLLNNYTDETTTALKVLLNNSTCDIVNGYLKSCEGLPQCYIEFGTKMYKSRYDFAKNMYRQYEEKENKKSSENYR